jgi:hypothetical protein
VFIDPGIMGRIERPYGEKRLLRIPLLMGVVEIAEERFGLQFNIVFAGFAGLTVGLSVNESGIIGVGDRIKMIVSLEVVEVFDPGTGRTRGDIGIKAVWQVTARRFRRSDVIHVFVKERFGFDPVAFSEIGGCITSITKGFREVRDIRVEAVFAAGTTIIRYPVAVGIGSGEEHSPVRAAEGMIGNGLREDKTASRKAVDVGGNDRIRVAAHVTGPRVF